MYQTKRVSVRKVNYLTLQVTQARLMTVLIAKIQNKRNSTLEWEEMKSRKL